MKTTIRAMIAVALAIYASLAAAKEIPEIKENEVIEITASDLWKKLKRDWDAYEGVITGQ